MLHLSLSLSLDLSFLLTWSTGFFFAFFFHFGFILCWSLTDRSQISFRTHIDHAAARERERESQREKKAACWGQLLHCRNHDKHETLMNASITQTYEHWFSVVFTLELLAQTWVCLTSEFESFDLCKLLTTVVWGSVCVDFSLVCNWYESNPASITELNRYLWCMTQASDAHILCISCKIQHAQNGICIYLLFAASIVLYENLLRGYLSTVVNICCCYSQW